MANSNNLPLYEKIELKRTVHRVLDITILSLLVLLLTYRLFFLHIHGFSWLQATAFLCESWFTFIWVLLVATRWNFFDYKTYPHRLLKRVEELPPVDIFVTTADAELEPPIITINTVLSLLAVDYPADKLACYVSDDGGSPVTFYSLSEALNFAKIWVPFCKKYKIQVRAPFRYFYNNNNDHDLSSGGGSPDFRHEWTKVKDEYEKLTHRIEKAALRDLTVELPDFSNIKSNNHPSIIKVIWENKEALFDGVPHLIYVSREKSPKHQHHYKAGAMNVLTRVSGLMTNAPYTLNVDCDMFVNNPSIILQAMCLLLDPIIDKEQAFVQFPQSFYNGLEDDPYGNQFHVLQEFIIRGTTGLQGPCYLGTGCIHRRKVLYGQSPDGTNIFGNNVDELQKTFGKSENLKNSAVDVLRGIITHDYPSRPSDSHSLEALKEVASCDYEYNSYWGAKVGWLYGSATEDLLTGMGMHKKGWKSVFVVPNPKAFLGCAPTGGATSLTQQKRWVTGQLEVLFSRKCPIFTFIFDNDNLQLRQCMFYLWILLWGIRSIPELLYSLLPAYCLIANSRFLPNVQGPAACIPLLLFVVYNFQQLLQYLEVGQSIRTWWNNQKMGRVNTMCAYLFGVVGILLKLLGLSETMFEITKKGSSSSNDDGEMEEDSGRFTFDESPLFVPATTVLMIQLAALSIGLLRSMEASHVDLEEFGVGEMICSVWLILCFWPFFKGMFAKGRFGIPWPTLFKSSALTLIFVFFVLKK